MKEVIVRLTSDHMKVKGGEYVRDYQRGEWIEHKGRTIVSDNNFIDFFPTEYECSNCGLRHTAYNIDFSLPNFCPNCGADMREREDE